MSGHVAVLMGGWSREREISLVTGKACAEALREEGFRTSEIDVGRDIAKVLDELAPDVAFNALHGRWGEDGCIQGVLEVLQIPYTHSGVRASAMAMDKPVALDVFRDAGIPCPDGRLLSLDQVRDALPFDEPYVIKPTREGSTIGVHIVRCGGNRDVLTEDWEFGDEVLVERYIPGRELSVAVLGDEALGCVELRPLSGFYDYDAKYTDGLCEHLMPAPVDPSIYDNALAYAATAHRALGCRGVTRTDFRYDDTAGEPGRLYMLELNTQPGMTPLSLVPEIARHRGISFGALVRWMVEDATCDR